MTQDLFIDTTLSFEKVASEVALPEDPNAWPNEILQELFKQVPYISDFEPHVVMDRVDAERGYAFGHVEVMNKTEIQRNMDPQAMAAAGIKQVRIPIIVRDCKLQPFDTLVTENSRVIPLTEARLRSSVFRPQAFDVTSLTPGDSSMIGQLYPPFRQGNGMGGGGAMMGAKMASTKEAALFDDATKTVAKGLSAGKRIKNPTQLGVDGAALSMKHPMYRFPASMESAMAKGDLMDPRTKTGSARVSLLAAILPTIDQETYTQLFEKLGNSRLQSALVANAEATAGPLGLLSKYEPVDTMKMAAAIYGSIPCNVVQLTKLAQGYRAKSANSGFWEPVHTVYDRGGAVKAFGEKIVLAADMNGTVTATEDAKEGPSAAPSEANAVAEEGALMEAEGGPELISEFGTYTVRTEEGEELTGYVFPELIDVDGNSLPMMLFTNGEAACLQGEISGTPGEGEVMLAEGHPRGYGFFFDGQSRGTIPLDIKATLDAGEGVALVGETFDGRQVHVMVQPNISEIAGEGDHMLVPDTMQWISLDQDQAVKLVGDPIAVDKTASPGRFYGTVTLRSGGEDSYSLAGFPVEKLASAQKDFLNFDETVFLLAGLGVQPNLAMQKMAEAWGHSAPVDIRIGRQIKLASFELSEQEKLANSIRSLTHELRVDLLKEAAVIPDPVAVDTVLSLGFINPENLGTFIGYLPLIDEAQSRMCELLVASRLGLRDVPTPALEHAVRATEEVLEGLKVLAFQKN